jgi:hypothetical protein
MDTSLIGVCINGQFCCVTTWSQRTELAHLPEASDVDLAKREPR